MFRFFSKYKSLSEKAQVSIFFLAIMTTMIVITFITINIGKIAKDKTYSGNAADGGAIAGASVSAYAFNYVANANKDEDEKLEGNWNDFEKAMQGYMQNVQNLYDEYVQRSAKTQAHTCAECSSYQGNIERDIKSTLDKIGKENVQGFINQIHQLIKNAWPASNSDADQQSTSESGVIPNYAKLQEDFYIAIRERVHDDQQGQNDLYQNALYAGYIFNLHNDGTSHRLGKINQKLWSAFLKGITVQSVQNGKPETFSYVDGAGRFHIVTAIVNIQAMRTFEVVRTKENRQQIKQHLDESKREAHLAESLVNQARSAYSGGYACTNNPVCCYCHLLCCCGPTCDSGPDTSGDNLMKQADQAMQRALKKARDAEKGLKKGEAETSTGKKDTHDTIIVYIEDITHDRMVDSSDFQFHMGGPIKGMRGDVDVPNFYPPIASNAKASFRGQGNIGPEQKPSHEAQLISAN
ncbi:MAG: hypothetical protein NG712_05260 [Omnitrophica bacterium]|nr:hypothetical protein [Candidatus Omnitrophota bacterium]